MRISCLLIALAVSAVSLSGQTPAQSPERPPDPAGAISGVVVDGTSGDPLENAAVTIQGANANKFIQNRQFTDAKGRFIFAGVPAAVDYTLTATVPGYFSGTVSRDIGPTNQSTAIAVKADQWVRDVRVTVWKPGSISGRVMDETGEPVVGVYVRVLSRVPIAGREQLVAGPVGLTDDRGVYRIPGLDAGHYIVEVPSVQAVPSAPSSSAPNAPSPYFGINGRYPWSPPPGRDGRPRGYPMTFYPAARSVNDAVAIDVRLTEERSGVDISLAPVAIYSVSGTLQGPVGGLSLRLLPVGLEGLGNGGEAGAAPIAPDGSFTFIGVPSGSYFIDVRRRIPEFSNLTGAAPKRLPTVVSATSFSSFATSIQAAPSGVTLTETQYGSNQDASSSFAREPITVGSSDLTGVLVSLKSAGTMDGVVEFDVTPDKPDARPAPFQAGFSLEPALGQPDLGVPITQTQQGAFHFDGVRRGEYFLRGRPSKDWALKSVMWNGEDYTNKPFDATATSAFSGVKVTMTNRVSSVMGSVKEQAAAVILFPASQEQWTNYGFNPPNILSAFTSHDGTFRFEGLRAGDYFVVAVNPANRMAWLQPGFFNRMMPFASRITLGWQEVKTVALSLVAVPR